ncbi:MAG: alpha/beta fold hydrolase, partial [Caldilineaceae bacterium]|nr:alpha/beta fold hydrolase [Caldilineaceae bacterium]
MTPITSITAVTPITAVTTFTATGTPVVATATGAAVAASVDTVSTALLRFPSRSATPGPPVFILSADLFEPNKPLPDVDKILEFVALFNDDADVVVVGLRGFADARPMLRCAGDYNATLDEAADKRLLTADLGAYFSTCDEFWRNGGVDTAAFNAAAMAADVNAARAALGYATVKLVGIDFGSQIAMEIA